MTAVPADGQTTHPDGLTSAEAARRLAEHGPNTLPAPRDAGLALIFARQFLSPFIYILLVAAGVSFAIGQLPSAVFIVVVLMVNAAIGTVQEFSAQRSAAALREMVRGTARVVRDGAACTIDIEELVPGDVVLLASGAKVPADLRLTGTESLSVDQSALTGESLAVAKQAGPPVTGDAPVSERTDMCFAGTIVARGRGTGVVTATGAATELGAIARHVAGDRMSEMPLMVRIRRFTYTVAAGILGGIAVLVAIMLVQGGYALDEMLLMAIGLAVAAIPEGLPAALTVALAIGMRRMAALDVIIRKLVAVEALGSCTFICSDKTGTLTVNELTIRRAVLADGSEFAVSGEGVAPGGAVEGIGDEGQRARLAELCVTGVLANESQLDYAGGEWVSDGDIVDVAFLVLAKKLGLSLSGIRGEHRQADLIPYESERAFSGSLTGTAGGETRRLHVKGSPEKMLELCSQMETADGPAPIDRDALRARFEALAGEGYRIIALARREVPEQGSDAEAHLGDMTLLGMVAMIDPVRPEATEAIARCRRGGVEVAMVTGDHPATARAIAAQLGLCTPDGPVVTGAEIRDGEARGREALDALIRPARVFARIEPTQKEQIVDSLMRAGHFVAVTGDGVNDAPAMRKANAGVAMGKRGTDVAKETADLIIADDNFASIVDGIEQGRIVYANIRKVVALLIATGFSALLLFFLTALTGLPMPLLAVQLLWLNLIANGLQDVALAFEAKEGGELARPPRDPREPVFERHMIEHVLVVGGAMGLLAFAVFAWLESAGVAEGPARNLVLMLMVFFGNIHALSARSETRSIFAVPLRNNLFLVLAVPVTQMIHIGATWTPGLSDILGMQPVAPGEWLTLLAVALALLAVEEAHKWSLRARRRRAPR